MRKETFLSAEHFETTKYGKLRMKEPRDSSRGSHRRMEWLCDCGRTTTVAVCSVVNRNTSSCRKCNMLSAEDLRTRKFGRLLLKEPRDLMPGSRTKVTWVCDCGNETEVQPLSVTTGHTVSCGRCRRLSKEHFEATRYGSLHMASPAAFSPGSNKEVEWLCDCGGSIVRSLYLVTSGHTSTCGKCRHSDPEYWAKGSYGRLSSSEVDGLSRGSNKKVTWHCLCGNTTKAEVYTVAVGNIVSCGRCMVQARSWYEKNREIILSFRCPVRPDEFPPGWLYPLETIRGSDVPFRALCGSCKREYSPRLGNLRKGSSLTCGCGSNHTSGAAVSVRDFLTSEGVDSVLEHQVGPWSYDLYVPSANLVVEHNGLRWHSMPASKARDLAKYRDAVSSGLSYLMIFEDEWTYSRPKVESLLRSRLCLCSPESVRPSRCDVRRISHRDASPFYEAHHYIGKAQAKVHYGVFLGDSLVSCASFSIPSRQSPHPWELVRMASDPSYRVHGIWSKILRTFILDHRPSSVVSFSDNRLFTGAVYEKIGFRFDGEVRPDYCWAKGDRRYHKSGLRKRGAERLSGLTEGQLREAQGYRRVWDLGKKRWVFVP